MAVWKLPLLPVLAAMILVDGCTPALDWREVRFDAASQRLIALFPCRPEHRSRALVLGGKPVTMKMASCSAVERTYAVSFVDASDPETVTRTLESLRSSAVANVVGRATAASPLQLPGMTPNPLSGRVAIDGRLPDGKRVRVDAAFFAIGMRAYQASVVGAPGQEPAIDNFFAGLRCAT